MVSAPNDRLMIQFFQLLFLLYNEYENILKAIQTQKIHKQYRRPPDCPLGTDILPIINHISIFIVLLEPTNHRTVPEMLSAIDEKQKLFELTQMTFQRAMEEKNIHQNVTEELINPIIRWNLGQDADNINGLVGRCTVKT